MRRAGWGRAARDAARLAPALFLAAGQAAWPTWVPLTPAQFAAGGAFVNAWADADQDGDADLFVGFNGASNRLYRNHDGRFTDVAPESGVDDARATRAAAWGDFDADGDPDLLVGFTPGADPLLKLYRNDRTAFHDVASGAGLVVTTGAVRQVAWVDDDGDGDLDLFVAFRDRPNALFRQTAGRFADVAPAVGLADPRRTVGAVWFDADEDGDLDLVTANMDGDPNGLFLQSGGRYVDAAGPAGVSWGGRTPRLAAHGTVRPCADDVDGDGRFDLFFANYGPNGLFLNRGRGRFEDASLPWRTAIDGRYDACAFADVDHDGRLDLYVNGTVTGGRSYRDYLLRNTGWSLAEATPPDLVALQADHGVAWADWDGDGDLDLALTGSGADGMHLLFENRLDPALARRSVQVRVVDDRGVARFAGAEVRVLGGLTRHVLGARLVDAGSGYNTQQALPVHVGLRSAGLVDIEVTVASGGLRRVTRRAGVRPGPRPVEVIAR
jgi:hypothetical protein